MSAVEGLRQVEMLMERAARDAGRDPAAVKLVCVSKTHDGAAILPVLAAGCRIFGENRVQEAAGKWPALRASHPDIELHLIGPLQSNKAGDAVRLFDVIETVDREKIARALADEMARQNRFPRLFVQVNTGAEPQKAGILPGDVKDFMQFCRESCGLVISGLMCIPPAAEQASPHFALLARLAAEVGVSGLSMGMSHDYALAIALGATQVRVGSAIFGART
ncbi:MAG: YggS family pyridoxal phosphate-dependent enzyme [Hyphomicrobiales bacterium]|nr:YggS family pyridoxal phosphate-dependent enzyme [Hyphomicrobiales bacterium]